MGLHYEIKRWDFINLRYVPSQTFGRCHIYGCTYISEYVCGGGGHVSASDVTSKIDAPPGDSTESAAIITVLLSDVGWRVVTLNSSIIKSHKRGLKNGPVLPLGFLRA